MNIIQYSNIPDKIFILYYLKPIFIDIKNDFESWSQQKMYYHISYLMIIMI